MQPERVADYPRPPRLEPVTERIRIVLGGETIASTTAAMRVLETTHPPTYYIPPGAFIPGALTPSARSSFCEWKGHAEYCNVTGGGQTRHDAGWFYPAPTPAFEALRGFVAVYCRSMESCWVGEEQATPQPGGFYGGWVTSNLVGPFKGERGTESW